MIETIDKQRIIDLCGLDERRIRNIYMYGSQVYGTNTEESDYDFLVLGCSMNAHKEFHDGTYNVHIKTPDLFGDELRGHFMSALECYYAPDFAIIQEKEPIDFKLKPSKVKKRSLALSHQSWVGGKRKIIDGDLYRGTKSVRHSIRILEFASQLLETGMIYDFARCNALYDSLQEADYVKWRDVKSHLFKEKEALEDKVKDFEI